MPASEVFSKQSSTIFQPNKWSDFSLVTSGVQIDEQVLGVWLWGAAVFLHPGKSNPKFDARGEGKQWRLLKKTLQYAKIINSHLNRNTKLGVVVLQGHERETFFSELFNLQMKKQANWMSHHTSYKHVTLKMCPVTTAAIPRKWKTKSSWL